MTIQNKIIIVTGASMGIGKATAELLAQKGATVVLAARSKDALNELSKKLPGSYVIQTDMTDPKSIEHMITETKNKFGRIDVLVNNAGQGIYGAIEQVDIDAYRKIYELNVVGPFIAMQKVIPIMREQGGGTIVNVSSMVSKNYFPLLGAYASTKYALNALSLTARAELKKDNIVVSIVLPGLTDTEFGKNSIKPAELNSMSSRNRPNMPEADSAELVAQKIADSIENGDPETVMH